MKQLTIKLTDAELSRLKRLAAAKTKTTNGRRIVTVQDCVREFARTCQPDGGGWIQPGSE